MLVIAPLVVALRTLSFIEDYATLYAHHVSATTDTVSSGIRLCCYYSAATSVIVLELYFCTRELSVSNYAYHIIIHRIFLLLACLPQVLVTAPSFAF